MGRTRPRSRTPGTRPRAGARPRAPAFLLVGLLVVTVLAGCTSSDDQDGGRAPDFSVTTIDDETFTLSDQEGRVVLVYFMGVGCTSCARNLPHHKALWDTHGDDPRFRMIALNSWATHGIPGESDEDMRDYRDREGISWPMARAPVDTVDDYNVRGTPSHVFIDAESRIRGSGNVMEYDKLDAQVQALLDEIPA